MEAAQAAGMRRDVGPFATAIEGEPSAVFAALHRVVAAGTDAGATRISIQVTVE